MRNPSLPDSGIARLLQAVKDTRVDKDKPASFEEFLRRKGHRTQDESLEEAQD